MEEKRHTPTQDFEVYEKMDGSLGILFNYNGEWLLATRGSFSSDQAIRGMEILRKYKYKYLPTDTTYLFEIIYPENRIVCKYEYEDLIMIGSIHTASGTEYNIYSEGYEELGFPLVHMYNGVKDYRQLKDMISANAEGFIVKFSNGDRMKIKGDEYLRLHRIMTNVSTTSLWEYLKDGSDIYNLLKDVPDEFYTKIDNYIEELKSQYILLDAEYKWFFKQCEHLKGNRAEFAAVAKRFKYPAILFRMLDNVDYADLIWKMIKPKFEKL